MNLCLECEEPVLDHELPEAQKTTLLTESGGQKRLMHRECWNRSIFGSVNHQMKKCMCFGGTENEDPPGMTKREAAIAACKLFESNRH